MSISKNNYSELIQYCISAQLKGRFYDIKAIWALEYSFWKEYVLIVVMVEFNAIIEFGGLNRPHSFRHN